MPEPESSPSAEGEVDYSALLDPNTEGAGGQSPGQQHAGTEPPTEVEGEDTRVRSPTERPPAQPVAGTFRRSSPPRREAGPGAAPGGRSAGAIRPTQAPKSGSKKRKLDAASG